MEILDSHSDCYHNDPNQAMNDYKSERAMRKQSEIDRRPPIRTYFGYVLANSNRKVSKSAKIHTQDISKKCMKDTQPSHRSHPTKTVDIHNQKAAPDDIQYVRVGDWISIHVNRQEYDGQICPDGPIRTRRRYVGKIKLEHNFEPVLEV